MSDVKLIKCSELITIVEDILTTLRTKTETKDEALSLVAELFNELTDAPQTTCSFTRCNDGTADTKCGSVIHWGTGFDFKYCPYCGSSIVEAKEG